MVIFKDPAEMRSFLDREQYQTMKVGFVPTMGALHTGHITLIDKARDENDLVVASIFVNPTQFNDPRDFEKYPQTIDKDVYQLEKAGCDLLLLPAVKDIYPEGSNGKSKLYDIGYLENILEGKYRPGHFQGVCQVMHKLLDIVQPGNLYLGQKDFQQCMVIRRLIGITGMEVNTVICATERESDGLAMSSRNLRLNDRERQQAPAIFIALQTLKQSLHTTGLGQLRQAAVDSLTEKGFRVDYVEIAKRFTLEPAEQVNGEPLVALAAAYLNEVRLIDNLLLNN